MLTKLAAALVAVTMFTAPVLAQSATAPASSAPVTQAAKPAPAAKKVVKVKKQKVKKPKTVKHPKPDRTMKAAVAPSTQKSGKVTAPRVN